MFTLQLHFENERLGSHFPSPESSNPRHTYNGMDGRWVEGKRNKMGPCSVHLHHSPTRPLCSSLWHWDVYKSQSTPSWTKGAHSTPHPNCRAHHRLQTLRWRGPGLYATPCWQQARSLGTGVAVPPYPPPLHLQIDTQTKTAGQTDRNTARQDGCMHQQH